MNRSLLLKLLFAAWAAAFVLSILVPAGTAPTGDGFARGLNRVALFFGWQAGATVIAFALWIAGWGMKTESRRLRWLSRGPVLLQGGLVLAFVGLLAYMNLGKPAPASQAPGPVTAPVEPPSRPQPPPGTAVVEYHGVYRSGFERSHFYPADGSGPWWLEADPGNWETLQHHYQDAPGRAGGAYLALALTGWTEPADDLAAVGTIDTRLHLVTIENLRPLAPDEFEALRAAFQRQTEETSSGEAQNAD